MVGNDSRKSKSTIYSFPFPCFPPHTFGCVKILTVNTPPFSIQAVRAVFFSSRLLISTTLSWGGCYGCFCFAGKKKQSQNKESLNNFQQLIKASEMRKQDLNRSICVISESSWKRQECTSYPKKTRTYPSLEGTAFLQEKVQSYSSKSIVNSIQVKQKWA